MLNPHLKMNKAFKDQVKTCLSNTFGADTNRHINKTLMNRYTRVLALVVFYEHGTFNPGKSSLPDEIGRASGSDE